MTTPQDIESATAKWTQYQRAHAEIMVALATPLDPPFVPGAPMRRESRKKALTNTLTRYLCHVPNATKVIERHVEAAMRTQAANIRPCFEASITLAGVRLELDPLGPRERETTLLDARRARAFWLRGASI